MKVSIVIPCYASAKFLRGTVGEIRQKMDSLKQYEYEVILVNDCSPDSTFEVIRSLVREDSHITGIGLAKNFGQHAALMAGFQYVTGDIVVCMDDDGQTPAAELDKLLDAISDDCDVVYARYQTKKHAWYRNLGSKVNSLMTEWMLGKPRDLYVSSYFAAKRYVVDEMKKYSHAFPYVIGLVLRTTKSIKNVDVNHRDRVAGESGYSLKKLFALWLNGFTAFSIMPLRLADLIGALCAGAGFLFMVFVVIRRLLYGDSGVMGWSSLISVVLFIGGILMCILGIIGEYIGRIYICINNAPQYVVKEIVGECKRNLTKGDTE
ncbi:MAG: glycosyltransferase [Eubacterium sp.]|nr:glycosyltransferase [Eubacterium sp.]